MKKERELGTEGGEKEWQGAEGSSRKGQWTFLIPLHSTDYTISTLFSALANLSLLSRKHSASNNTIEKKSPANLSKCQIKNKILMCSFTHCNARNWPLQLILAYAPRHQVVKNDALSSHSVRRTRNIANAHYYMYVLQKQCVHIREALLNLFESSNCILH